MAKISISLTDNKITQEEAGLMMAPLELDLMAFFKTVEKDVLNNFEQKGSPEDLINNILDWFNPKPGEEIEKSDKGDNMPKPKPGESEKDYVARCIHIVMNEDSSLTQKQAAGKCYGMFRNRVDKAERKTVRGYLSPEPGNISDKENDILANTYASAREKGYDKEKSAKIAWGAVNNYKKNKSQKVKKSIIIGKIVKSINNLNQKIENRK